MKVFVEPLIEIAEFGVDDILTTSFCIDDCENGGDWG